MSFSCSILNCVLLAHPSTLSVSLREAFSGLGNVALPSDTDAAATTRTAFRSSIAQSIAEVDNRHMFPAFSSYACIQLLSDDEVRSFLPALQSGVSTQQAAAAFLKHLDGLLPPPTDSVDASFMASATAAPLSAAQAGFGSITPTLPSHPSGAADTPSAAASSFPDVMVAAFIRPHVHTVCNIAPGLLSGGRLIDWVQANLPGEELLQAATHAFPQLQQEQGLQRAKVQRILELLRGWCAAIALLPDPLLLPHTGKGASGTLQSGRAKVQRQPASSMPLHQLRVHSKAGLYKVEACGLVSLAPTPRTYATVLAACLDAAVTQPVPRLLLQLERTARPSVQHWALGCLSQLQAGDTPLNLGLPPLKMSELAGGSHGSTSAVQPEAEQVDVSILLFVLQEQFLHRLAEAGFIQTTALQAALAPPPNTPQAALLKAARSAALGNQKGSKHGGVVVHPATGGVLVSGHNHSYTAPQKAHDVPLGSRFLPTYTQQPSAAAAPADSAAAQVDASSEARPTAAKRARRDGGERPPPPNLVMHPPVLPSAAEAAALQLPPKLLHSRRNKVMHAEVHCLTRLAVPFPAAETAAYAAAFPLSISDSEDAVSQAAAAAAAAGVVHAPGDSNITSIVGCDVWVVELDAAGVGFEEAVPCTNCNVALIQQGVARVRYTCHTGVHTQEIRPNPWQPADTLQFGVNARVLNWLRHCQGLPQVPVPGQPTVPGESDVPSSA